MGIFYLAIVIFCRLFYSRTLWLFIIAIQFVVEYFSSNAKQYARRKWIRISCVIIYLRDFFLLLSYMHDVVFTGFHLSGTNGRRNAERKKQKRKTHWMKLLYIYDTHTRKYSLHRKTNGKIDGERKNIFKNEMRTANERKKNNFLLGSLISGRNEGIVRLLSVIRAKTAADDRSVHRFINTLRLTSNLHACIFYEFYLFLLWYSCKRRA